MALWIVVETTEDGVVGTHALSTRALAVTRKADCDEANKDNPTWHAEIFCVEVDDYYTPPED